MGGRIRQARVQFIFFRIINLDEIWESEVQRANPLSPVKYPERSESVTWSSIFHEVKKRRSTKARTYISLVHLLSNSLFLISPLYKLG